MDDAKNQLVERLKTANSVLITVSKNPSVDQLAACIGLTLIINKMNKHGSAVFSGQVPSTISFLKPDDTIEKTPDSLRDFIIALDKNKADKLRYKVEDQVVKIFITPYKTSLSEKDFEFTQGDFNVELIIALGVHDQEDLDSAIVAHGRILHDATVACINTTQQSSLGNITWQDATASSLCELVTDLEIALGGNILDEQIATALLTGIISETNRFSNEKTSSQTMNVSGKLMSAGANQQLVATNLEEVKANVPRETSTDSEQPKADNIDGTLSIDHERDLDLATLPTPSSEDVDLPPIQSNDLGMVMGDNPDSQAAYEQSTPKLVTEPPMLGGTLTANSVPEGYAQSTDPLSATGTDKLPDLDNLPKTVIEPLTDQAYQPPTLQQAPPKPQQSTPTIQQLATMPQEPPAPVTPVAQPVYTPPPSSWSPPVNKEPEPPKIEDQKNDATLDDLERAVSSPHLQEVDSAREQVDAVLSSMPDNTPKPQESLNAMPLGPPIHQDEAKEEVPPEPPKPTIAGLDSALFSEVPAENEAAPPVPPPIDFNKL